MNIPNLCYFDYHVFFTDNLFFIIANRPFNGAA
jgi:hypothetical protein